MYFPCIIIYAVAENVVGRLKKKYIIYYVELFTFYKFKKKKKHGNHRGKLNFLQLSTDYNYFDCIVRNCVCIHSYVYKLFHKKISKRLHGK